MSCRPLDDSLGRLLLLGTNRQRISALAAKRLFATAPKLPDLLTELSGLRSREALVLATHERLEYLVARDEQFGGVADLLSLVASRSGVPAAELGDAVYVHEGEGAVRHIFEVAASLEIHGVDEPQALERLKDCHEAARQRDMTGPILDRVLSAAYAAADRVRAQTPIAARSVSMAAVAAQVAQSLHGDLARARVLLVGLGEMSELRTTALIAAS